MKVCLKKVEAKQFPLYDVTLRLFITWKDELDMLRLKTWVGSKEQ